MLLSILRHLHVVGSEPGRVSAVINLTILAVIFRCHNNIVENRECRLIDCFCETALVNGYAGTAFSPMSPVHNGHGFTQTNGPSALFQLGMPTTAFPAVSVLSIHEAICCVMRLTAVRESTTNETCVYCPMKYTLNAYISMAL